MALDTRRSVTWKRATSGTFFLMSTHPEYNNTTNAEQVADAFKDEIEGRYFLITGANTGLGKETVRVLAKHGGIVTIACRSVKKGQEAKEDILKQFPNANITVREIDVSSLKSVKKFAEEYIATGLPIHVLLNNAGIMACPLSYTVDGIETQFGTNHLGHFYLTQLLTPVLAASASKEKPARIVFLSSLGHIIWAPYEGILFDDLDAKKNYNQWTRYGQSKLCNLMSAAHFDKVLQDQNIRSISLHPGIIGETELMRHVDFFGILSMMTATRVSHWLQVIKSKTIPQGTSTTLVCALDPKVEFGKYYFDCQLSNDVHELAFDAAIIEKLVKVSDELIAKAIAN